MGITIHYRGRAKSLAAIDDLRGTLTDIATASGWNYGKVDRAFKGKLQPNWGMGYGYIPKSEQQKKENIEYFPKMVSKDCNGYFKIFDTKYAAAVRAAFSQERWPSFYVDTVVKGIWVEVHPDCEGLEFTFDLKTLELASYETYDHSPGIVHGYGGLFCKTQFAGFEAHKTVCKLIKMAERYIEFSDIYDEAGYYHSQDEDAGRNSFAVMTSAISNLGKELTEAAKKHGFGVSLGGKIQ
ncbi:MAG: hypothetical protein L0Y80_01250 [Ignavibacteriae bacterium]|nr:hypothetical protein [Ignavibacteriota bacterium]